MNLPDDIDKGVIPLVEYFNEHGLKTNMSCEGHKDEGYPYMTMFWISFDPSVRKEDISSFMKKHLDPKFHNFYSCGRFAERFFVFNSIEESSHWCYFAANVDAAMEDLKHWQTDDKGEGYRRD